MRYLLNFVLLFPLAICLPQFFEEDRHPPSTELLTEGRKWISLAQFDWDDYVLSGVSLDCDRETSNQPYSCEYKFHWDDPNYDNSMDCNKTFEWDGVTLEPGRNNNFSTDSLLICGFWWQFKIDVVRSLWDFNMTITKDQKDPSKFGSRTAQFFAYPNITMEKMGQTDFRHLAYSTQGPVKAKIQGMTL